LLLYRVLAALTLAAYAPVALLRRAFGGRRLGDWKARLGGSPTPDLSGGVWIHAVSVGEVGVAAGLFAALHRRLPGVRIGVSTTTAAGREVAERTFAGRAPVFAFPFDLARPVERALDAARPSLVVLTETEIWPLFIERAARRGIRVALVNGRISERSFARYRRVSGWMRPTLKRISLYAMQSLEDARRARDLGAPAAWIHVLPNVKFDATPAPGFADAPRLRAAAGSRAIVVAGSTGEGEEVMLLDAWQRVPERPLLVLAPRRPERFDAVARLVETRGLSLARRSSPHVSRLTSHGVDVYLLDSMGELASVYREAALAYAGGSLIPTGGQNPIEAWSAGVPVLSGPHMENFRAVAAAGEELGILRRVSGTDELSRALAEALGDRPALARLGERARRLVEESRGAAERTAELIAELLEAKRTDDESTAGRRRQLAPSRREPRRT
jgi:3-deoxy-D-manno-octulosonic-acid transferase